METYWVPGVNTPGGFDRWAIAGMTDVWEMERSRDWTRRCGKPLMWRRRGPSVRMDEPHDSRVH